PWAMALVGVAVALLAGWQTREALARGALATAEADRRYVDVGAYASTLPSNAVVFAGLHAGSIRYYSDRATLRYDWLEPGWLDQSVMALAEQGYRPYIALDEGEEPGFRARFGSASALARLDWPPMAARLQPIRVRIYDPADRVKYLAGARIV